MKISSQTGFSPVPQFVKKPVLTQQPEGQQKTTPQSAKQNAEKRYSPNEMSNAILATTLSAIVVGTLIYGKGGKTLVNLAKKNKNLKNEREILQQVLEKSSDKIRTLESEIRQTQEKLSNILEGDLTPQSLREDVYNKYKAKINSEGLNYDVKNPPITGRGSAKTFEDAVELPDYAGTSNRAGMQKLDIPEILPDGSFDFKLPESSEMTITRVESKEFTPVKNQMTNITESYADSVQWNNDKIARDVLQNFYDGHGQTLDGVHLTFTPQTNGKYKIRIKGDSTYTADKAVYIGETTKRDNAKAAGNYGEGLKMSVLKLLKDAGTDEVRIGSDNWKLTYSFRKGDLSDKRVLSYSLDKVDRFDGNYVEFETSDKSLLETFKKSINRFYHSNNTHFECPDFENELIGIKLLPKGEKGGVYISGQRFEFNNDYDGLKEIVLFLKEKPPVDILDPSRDRISLNADDFESIAIWLTKDKRMTFTDKANLIKALEPYWRKKNFSNYTPMDYFLIKFLNWVNCWDHTDIHINFPSKYVAYSDASIDIVSDLGRNGYNVCHDAFTRLGMQTIRDLIGDARAHDVVIPGAIQTKKIFILKEAINALADSLKRKHFDAEELDTKIFLFDKSGPKENKLNKTVLAEALVDSGRSKGFWIDKEYFKNAKFSEVLETALHELSHKAGGDESSEFSYKLTDVNKAAIEQILSDAETRIKLQALDRLWQEISNGSLK